MISWKWSWSWQYIIRKKIHNYTTSYVLLTSTFRPPLAAFFMNWMFIGHCTAYDLFLQTGCVGVFGSGKSYLLAVVVMFLTRLFELNDWYTSVFRCVWVRQELPPGCSCHVPHSTVWAEWCAHIWWTNQTSHFFHYKCCCWPNSSQVSSTDGQMFGSLVQ